MDRHHERGSAVVRRRTSRFSRMGWPASARFAVLFVGFAVAFTGSTRATATIDFEQQTVGTVVTNQYAGQGIVFGPLPAGAGNANPPVVQAPPAGQAQSG